MERQRPLPVTAERGMEWYLDDGEVRREDTGRRCGAPQPVGGASQVDHSNNDICAC